MSTDNKDTNKEQTKDDREQIYLNSLKTAENAADNEEEVENGEEEKKTKVQPSETVKPGSLGKVKSDKEERDELHQENKEKLSNVGYRKIDVANLPSKGQFNDASLRIKMRAATFEEIKHYSGLDETDLIDVSDHINDIVKSCLRIEYENRIGKFSELHEADKYYILFAIRDLTMEVQQRFNKLQQPLQCPKCGKRLQVEITSHAFSHYTIPKPIAKYYDEEIRKIVVMDDNFGDTGPLVLSPPTIGLTTAIQKYMQEHARKQQAKNQAVYFDAQFMLKLQYLLDDESQVNEASLTKLKKQVASWSPEKLIAFEYIRDHMDVGVRPQLEVVCKDHESIDKLNSREVGCTDDFSFSAPVEFQHGWRSLLDISGVISRLFDDSE